MHLRVAALAACLLVLNTVATAAVTLNGSVLPHADARPDATVAVNELRESSDPAIRLVPGIKRYGVAIVSKSVIAALEAELPLDATPTRFTVGIDGRTFRNCVVTTLTTDPLGTERLVYTLRCEGVTVA